MQILAKYHVQFLLFNITALILKKKGMYGVVAVMAAYM